MSSCSQSEHTTKPWTTRGTSHLGRGLSAVRKVSQFCTLSLLDKCYPFALNYTLLLM